MGKFVATVTIVCLDCKELDEAVTQELLSGPAGEPVTRPLRCAKRHKHRVQAWVAGDGRPKCGEPMEKGDSVVMWN